MVGNGGESRLAPKHRIDWNGTQVSRAPAVHPARRQPHLPGRYPRLRLHDRNYGWGWPSQLTLSREFEIDVLIFPLTACVNHFSTGLGDFIGVRLLVEFSFLEEPFIEELIEVRVESTIGHFLFVVVFEFIRDVLPRRIVGPSDDVQQVALKPCQRAHIRLLYGKLPLVVKDYDPLENLLEELASNFAEQMGIEVGVLAAVPNGFKRTNDQEELIDTISFPTPEIIPDRTSLMEGCWKQQCSAFEYVRTHRDRQREYEIETLAQFDRLARYLEAQADIEAPNPPEPGALKEDVPA